MLSKDAVVFIALGVAVSAIIAISSLPQAVLVFIAYCLGGMCLIMVQKK